MKKSLYTRHPRAHHHPPNDFLVNLGEHATMAELKEAGYNKNRHSYLPLEVKLIFKYLGEP